MAASGKQPAEFNNFSGGITDNQWSGEMNSGVQMDNFIITPDQKLMSRAGSVVDDETNSPIPLGNARISRLVNYARNTDLFAFSNRNIFYRGGAVDGVAPWVSLLGPTGNNPFDSDVAPLYPSTAEWNRQVFVVGDSFPSPVKFYKDGLGNYQLRNVGLPALASAPTVSTTAASGTHSYVYGFVYTYTYTVGPSTFEEVGPVTWVTITNSDAPSTTPNTIANIPVLSGSNYDTSNVRVQIYRTINNGAPLYLAGEVVNGTLQFFDSMDDDTLQTKPALYTNDGTQDYSPAPRSKFIHITGNIGYYGYTSDEFGLHPYRVHQSVPGNPVFAHPRLGWKFKKKLPESAPSRTWSYSYVKSKFTAWTGISLP